MTMFLNMRVVQSSFPNGSNPKPSRTKLRKARQMIVFNENDMIEFGTRMGDALKAVTGSIGSLCPDPKDVERVNRCFAMGNPEPEYNGSFQNSITFSFLKRFADLLQENPSARSLVVDHHESSCSEDCIWMSLPKWQSYINVAVVTVRSIERSVFRDSFENWTIEHAQGPRGTTFVELNGLTALFSDQPRNIALHGPHLNRGLVLRVFRCAPRDSLRAGIASVLAEQTPPNVFDLWIRHHEIPETFVPGEIGKYLVPNAAKYQGPIFELLTAVIDDTKDAGERQINSFVNVQSLEKENNSPEFVTNRHTKPEKSRDSETSKTLDSDHEHSEARDAQCGSKPSEPKTAGQRQGDAAFCEKDIDAAFYEKDIVSEEKKSDHECNEEGNSSSIEQLDLEADRQQVANEGAFPETVTRETVTRETVTRDDTQILNSAVRASEPMESSTAEEQMEVGSNASRTADVSHSKALFQEIRPNVQASGEGHAKQKPTPKSSLECAACKAIKPKTQFSKAQLKKKEARRCKECVA